MESKKSFQVNGVKTVVFDEGEGPPVVMLHGMFATSDCWLYTFDDLCRDHRVVAPDLPGYGQTDSRYQPYSLRFYTRWLAGLLDQLELDRVTLIGNSMGGAISIVYALDHPERVDRLVLVDSLGMNDQIPWQTGWWLFKRLPQLIVAKTTHKFDPHLFQYLQRRIIFDPWGIARCAIEDMADLNSSHFAKSLYASSRLLLADFATGTQRRRFTQQLDLLTLPTLIVWGQYDRVLPVKNAYKGKQRIRHAQLNIFEHSAHLPMLEEPELFNRIIRCFFDRETIGEIRDGRPKTDAETEPA